MQITELSRIEFEQCNIYPSRFNLRELLADLYATLKI